MRDIIRSGKTAGYARALIFCLLPVAALFGQAPAAGQAGAVPEPASQAAPSQTPPSQTPPSQAGPAEDAGRPAAKGKSASKDSKSGTGMISATGVDAKPYEIGPEDILFVNVLHQAEVSGQVPVGPDGLISMRFAGEIKAAGLTAEQLSAVISEKLLRVFNRPEVNVQVMKIYSKKYYVSGEVRRPGAYVLTAPKTVLEAITEAGGLADFAKGNKVYILRAGQQIKFNYRDVIKNRHLEQNIVLQNGDHIVIP